MSEHDRCSCTSEWRDPACVLHGGERDEDLAFASDEYLAERAGVRIVSRVHDSFVLDGSDAAVAEFLRLIGRRMEAALRVPL